MSVSVTAEQIPAMAPGFRFQWEEAQGCYVILYPEGMVKLNSSAGEILKLCDAETSVGAIIAELSQRFDNANIAPDVYQFLEVARENGWIHIRQSS